MKVLIVDSLEYAAPLADLLQSTGYEFVVAHTAESAFRRAIREKVDVAIIEHDLPDINGKELAKTLHKHRPEIKQITMTNTNRIMRQLRQLDKRLVAA